MKKLAFLLLFVGTVMSLSAQERGLYTQYYLNQELINPAYTGFENNQKILLNYRNRWATFPGNPKMITLSYVGRVSERIGLGGQIMTENIGALNRFKAQLQYSYLFGNEDFDFGLGLTTEYQQYGLDNSALVSDFYDPGDEIVQAAADNLGFFDVTLGMHGVYQDDLFFGITLPGVVHARVKSIDVDGVTEPMSELFENYLVYFGYDFYIDRGDFHLEPSLMFRDVRGIDFEIDFNLKGSFLDERLIGGISYSTGASNRLGFLIGTRFEGFQFAYSYDASFLDFQDYNSGGHEFSLGILLDERKSEAKMEQ